MGAQGFRGFGVSDCPTENFRASAFAKLNIGIYRLYIDFIDDIGKFGEPLISLFPEDFPGHAGPGGASAAGVTPAEIPIPVGPTLDHSLS